MEYFHRVILIEIFSKKADPNTDPSRLILAK